MLDCSQADQMMIFPQAFSNYVLVWHNSGRTLEDLTALWDLRYLQVVCTAYVDEDAYTTLTANAASAVVIVRLSMNQMCLSVCPKTCIMQPEHTKKRRLEETSLHIVCDLTGLPCC